MTATTYQVTAGEKKFIGWHLLVAVIALSIGSLFGPLQAFQAASSTDLYKYLKPLIQSYYQGLTLHGVLNALIWTTFFITGFLTLTTIYGLRRPLRYPAAAGKLALLYRSDPRCGGQLGGGLGFLPYLYRLAQRKPGYAHPLDDLWRSYHYGHVAVRHSGGSC